MRNLLNKYGVYALTLLWATACFAFFQWWYPYHFFYQEQNQLFLWSSDYLQTYFDKPAWLACMAGDFLTQFYYYLYAGSAILTLILLLTGDMTRRAVKAIHMRNKWLPYLAGFIAMTMEALLSLHYGFRLSSVLSFAGGAATFWLSTALLNRIDTWIHLENNLRLSPMKIGSMELQHCLSLFSILLCVPFCFWLFGYGVWIYAILVFTGSLLYIKQAHSYLRVGVLAGCIFLLMLSKRVYFLDFDALYSYPGIGKLVLPQMSLEKSFAVDDEYYFGNYNKVVRLVEEEEEPNQQMKFFYNLVMAQRRLLPDKLLAFNDNYLGTFESIGPGTPTLTLKSINELYWLLGDMTFAERAAILGNVCSPDKRNIRMMKRLAEINLASGDTEAAKKYLRILGKTFVWGKWSRSVLEALDEKANTGKSPAILSQYEEKAAYTNQTDTIRTSDNARIIMQELLKSNPDNHIALDYLLCSDLLLKDMESFKYDYDKFSPKIKATPYTVKLYQEALMIYLAGTHASAEEWEKYIYRTDILSRFRQYNQQRGSLAFKDTYWYYFDKKQTEKK